MYRKVRSHSLALLLLALPLLLAGCSSVDIERYAGTTPELDIGEYFEGRTRAWGMVQDYRGEVQRRFVVDIDGEHDGTTLVLDEHFVYDDGETDRRVWTFERQGDGRWVGSANDVEGPVAARQAGHAFTMTYRLPVVVSGREITFTMEDWMFLQPDGRLLNRTDMKKFGITLARITIVFERIAADAPNDNAPDT
ncbi:DUF3833 domain-containing protein [Halomonas sp. JS92-SW72]|uniref:DUF3833 domain-containing protein n=1 Tax=Halomonas sp. JS92-SW72 TaxID=2306583 RepID=UPI000E5BF36A|nr:DUF3833 domain-containing protein [Halomonas sp. JS92-SW72]AXY41496.1 DUF3833 domain-containing protein [Halomonas sp. JS92-SW72]